VWSFTYTGFSLSRWTYVRHTTFCRRTRLKMAEEARRAKRGDNAQLMESNLALLLEIREADSEIEDAKRELRAQCALLQKRGIKMPSSFTELLVERRER